MSKTTANSTTLDSTAVNKSKIKSDPKDIEIAKQILLEQLAEEEKELVEGEYDPLDPYGKTAKMIDQQQKAKLSKQSSEHNEEYDDDRNKKIQEFVDNVENNEDNIKLWMKRAKIAIALSIIVYCMYSSGALTTDQKFIHEELAQELFGLKNLILTIKEAWLCPLVFLMYYALRKYNEKLDREEEEYNKWLEEQENQNNDDDDNESQEDDNDQNLKHTESNNCCNGTHKHQETKKDK